MFGSEAIEVGIGMALLFFFMSLVATASCELLETFMKMRARELEAGIKELLSEASNPGFTAKFYDSPFIASLYRGKYKQGEAVSKDLPSYIPRQNFSLAVIQQLMEQHHALSLDGLKGSLSNAPNQNNLQKVVFTAIDTASGDLARTRQILEDWYDGTMDRVSGWYKRRSGKILLALGLLGAIAFNVDAIVVAQRLISDKNLRAAAVSAAQTEVEARDDANTTSRTVTQLSEQLAAIGFPIGWIWQDDGGIFPMPQSCTATIPPSGGEPVFQCKDRWYGVMLAVPGWLITALAVMLGAPFWFDILNKLMVIRSTVKPKEKSPDESSEDRSAGQAPAATPSRPAAGPGVSDPAAVGDGDPAQLLGASITSTVALADDAYEPHEWVSGDPQKGLL